MTTVNLDQARLLFTPTSYTRTPEGSETQEALAAHLRGVDASWTAQAATNFAVADSASQNKQYAILSVTDSASTLVGVAARVQLAFALLSPSFEYSRKYEGTSGNWAVSSDTITVPDTGLWGWAAELTIASSGAGVIWAFEWELDQTPVAIPYFRKTTAIAEPHGHTFGAAGRVFSLSGTQNQIRCMVSHDSGAPQTLTVDGIFARINRIDD